MTVVVFLRHCRYDVVRCVMSRPASPRSEQDKQDNRSVSGAKAWRNADLGTPEFFEWLNTIPADAAERLGE